MLQVATHIGPPLRSAGTEYAPIAASGAAYDPPMKTIAKQEVSIMKRIAICLLLGVAMTAGFVGCAETTKTVETKRVETPGGTATQQTTVEEKKTGDERTDAAPKP